MKTTKAYKLLRVRKNGTIGSLFINRKDILPIGKWLDAEDHPTKGFAHRPGWHGMKMPFAPHLSPNGRAWFIVRLKDIEIIERPASQGGIWFLAKKMKIVERM